MARHSYTPLNLFTALSLFTVALAIGYGVWIGLSDRAIRNTINANDALRSAAEVALQGRVDDIEMRLLASNFTVVESGVCRFTTSGTALINYELIRYTVDRLTRYYIRLPPPDTPLPTSTVSYTANAACPTTIPTVHVEAFSLFGCSLGTTGNPYEPAFINNFFDFNGANVYPTRIGEASKVLLDGTTPAATISINDDRAQCNPNSVLFEPLTIPVAGIDGFGMSGFIVGSAAFTTITWTEPLEFVIPT